MQKIKKLYVIALTLLFTAFTFLNYNPAYASKKPAVPEVSFITAPVTEYTVGDRVKFDISAPNYGGRVEYRVLLWEDSKKTSTDLWNSSNGYPSRYYTNWQPYGNNTFTLGWPINEPGSYRITVYVKRVGVPNNKAALKGMNCDSFKESVAFVVKPKAEQVVSVPDKEGQSNGSTDSSKPEGDASLSGSGNVNESDPIIIGGTGTGTEPLVVEAAGVVLSNGTKIAGTRVGQTNEFNVDLRGFARDIGVRTSVTVNKNCKLQVSGKEFSFSSGSPRVFGPKDFDLPDNDPPGVSIGNLIDNYSDNGYYINAIDLIEGTSDSVTVEINIKLQ